MIRLTVLVLLFTMTGQTSLPSPTTELQNPATTIVADGTSPAAVYLHFDADSILHRSVAGLADVALNKPVDKETTFNLFSVTKTLTATAILQLAEQGLVALDTPVVRYLGEFPYGDRVTLRHLLTHTGGLPNPLPLSWGHFPEEQERFDEHAFVETIFSKNPKTRLEPGAKMRYSNLAYVWLGWVIERVSRKPYEAYVQEHLLSKSGAGEWAGFRIDPRYMRKGISPTGRS
jgi:CubicO group peptidase (beta-lactamase class C family)